MNPSTGPSPADLRVIDAWWRAANFLTVGQIYLQDNALLRAPLLPEHIKPRLLGHWGTSPGLSLIYAHLNHLVRAHDADVLFLAGPGHGGPAMVANVYLEGSYTEVYPRITQDAAGIRGLVRQFSTPGGIPSHVGATTPGSIHEGGELGYVLAHAQGAVFDNPDLIAVAVVGDGEAETGPLEGSWKGISFLNPARDGAVLPILHLNGYKISGPTVLGRAGTDAIRALLSGHGYEALFVEGDDPRTVHAAFATALESSYQRIRAIQADARAAGVQVRPGWPAIVLRTPKGWTGPKVVNGIPIEGTFRAHQVPLGEVATRPAHLRVLETWMRSYRPEELFDAAGRLVEEVARLAPQGRRRMGANPHANGGQLRVALQIPDLAAYAVPALVPGTERRGSTAQLGLLLRDLFTANAPAQNLRLFCPDETNSNRLGAVFEVENRCLVAKILPGDDHVSVDGRVMEVLSEHLCEGWLEGYLLTGRHGLFASYEAFALIVASMATQHAKWLEVCEDLPWRAPVASLNILLTSTCWRNDHNGFSHQGPGFMDTILSMKGAVTRVYLPPDANCLLAVADHCLRSTDNINLLIIDKQPQLQWLDLDAARHHCAAGASVWAWAGNGRSEAPDIVLAAAGDTATLETLAAAKWLRRYAPELAVRVVNVVDLMTLATDHPHGMSPARFEALFTATTDVIFAYHGYPGAVHQLLHGRPDADRFHVRGYIEEGTSTTPFDMVVLNRTSRYHLCIEALQRTHAPPAHTATLIAACQEALRHHHAYIVAHLEDLPEVRDWTWTSP